MSRAVIAGYARTPFHFARKGKLAAVRPDDLAAIALRGLVTRLGLEPALVDDVLMGCAYPEGEQGTNVARIATLLAGFPDTVAGATINRFCGSSMTAVHYAAGQIAARPVMSHVIRAAQQNRTGRFREGTNSATGPSPAERRAPLLTVSVSGSRSVSASGRQRRE